MSSSLSRNHRSRPGSPSSTGRARRSRCSPRLSPRAHSGRPGGQEQRRPHGAGPQLVPPGRVRCSARGLAAARRRLGYGGPHRVQPASPAPPLRDAGTHGPICIAPIRIDRLRSWCSQTGNDPASGSARSSYAAELARSASDELIAGRRHRRDRRSLLRLRAQRVAGPAARPAHRPAHDPRHHAPLRVRSPGSAANDPRPRHGPARCRRSAMGRPRAAGAGTPCRSRGRGRRARTCPSPAPLA